MPVGAAWLRLWSGHERGYGYVDEKTPEISIALLKEYRGFGIGTRMIQEIILKARQQYPGISLSVVESSPARRLYERLGFKSVGRIQDSLTMLLRWEGERRS
jgi:GNAT superfamily N-acetyltransferase